MIINDFDVDGISIVPLKTDAPLAIDSDAVLTCTVAEKTFEAVGWWNAQVLDSCGPVQHT